MSEIFDEYTANKIKKFWGNTWTSRAGKQAVSIEELEKQLASERQLADELAKQLEDLQYIVRHSHKGFCAGCEILSKWKQARGK